MRAVALNCTLKPSPEESSTAALAQVVLDALAKQGVETDMIRVVDHVVGPGVVSEAVTDDDEWPALRARIVAAEILIVATPTWLGQQSSVCQRVLERMDAMLSETREDGRPLAYDRVAGVVVTGNEDGAHHIIGVVSQMLIDIGYTVPGQAWTYWNKGPGPGEEVYLTSGDTEWSDNTGVTAAQNLLSVARALQGNPMPLPST
jgi:multimeric flavodoxin WrbA